MICGKLSFEFNTSILILLKYLLFFLLLFLFSYCLKWAFYIWKSTIHPGIAWLHLLYEDFFFTWSDLLLNVHYSRQVFDIFSKHMLFSCDYQYVVILTCSDMWTHTITLRNSDRVWMKHIIIKTLVLASIELLQTHHI